jgi:hypothetical protein
LENILSLSHGVESSHDGFNYHASLHHSSVVIVDTISPFLSRKHTPPHQLEGGRHPSIFQISQHIITVNPKISSNPNFEELWNNALESCFVSMDRSPGNKAALRRIYNADDISPNLTLVRADSKFGGKSI